MAQRWTYKRLIRLVFALVVLAATYGFARALAVGALVRAPNFEQTSFAPVAGERRIRVNAVDLSISVHHASVSTASKHGTIFVLHGVRDRKESIETWAQGLTAAGYTAVLVDHRGQGRSTGNYLTYGVREAEDLHELASTLLESGQVDEPFGALGVSYGAATAIRWASIDPRVTAVVALAPFADLRSIVPNFSPVRLPNWFYAQCINAAGKEAGFDPDGIDTARSATQTSAQLLLIHGDRDVHIPLAHSQRIVHAASSHAELLVVRGADHLALFDDALTHLSLRAPAWFDKQFAARETPPVKKLP